MSTHFTDHPAPAARDIEVVEDRVSPFSRVGQVMVVGSGAVLTILGIVTLVRAGVSSDLTQPVVNVWGHTATPLLGLIELAVGVILIGLGASLAARSAAAVFGVLLIAAGILVLAIPGDMPEELALEGSYGWIPLATGVVATVGALLPEGVTRVRSRRIEQY